MDNVTIIRKMFARLKPNKKGLQCPYLSVHWVIEVQDCGLGLLWIRNIIITNKIKKIVLIEIIHIETIQFDRKLFVRL